jgi:hypothetical protein
MFVARASDGRSPEEQQARMLGWQRRQRPDNEVPGSLPVDAILFRSEQAAIVLTTCEAYSHGFDLGVLAYLRDPPAGDVGIRMAPHAPGELAIGVQYAGGRRAGTFGGGSTEEAIPEAERLRVQLQGGQTGNRLMQTSVRVTPLPPAGDVIVVAAWESQGIAECFAALSGDAIRAAAARAVVLWPWSPPPGRPAPEPPSYPPGSWFGGGPVPPGALG